MNQWGGRLVVLAFLLGACGEDKPPAPDFDSGRPDTGVVEDAGTTEDSGSVDEDAGHDAGMPTDAGEDVGDATVVFPDVDPPPPIVHCEDGRPPSECGDCEAGFACVDAFCGGQECVPARRCMEDAQCASGTCLRADDAPPEEFGYCEPFAGDCTADLDCLQGFRCEEGTCVDRRLPCGFHENNCPRGHVCTFEAVSGDLFCVPALTACRGDFDCEAGASCHDVDGDGGDECVPAGMCNANADCPEDRSCGVDPGTAQSSCEVDGACRDGACPEGFSCVDTGAAARCVAEGGSCTSDSECPPQAICGALEADDPLRCLTFDEEEGA